jgi:peroxiredoxin Q/BCP
MKKLLKAGNRAPLSVSIVDSNEKEVSLKDYLGKWVVLYFYPKDDTPGCTKEACSIRDIRGDIKKTGADVIGVSKDSPKSHLKFIDKYKLNFTLWSDPEHKLMEAFGSWQEKKFMGRTYMGTLRTTFIIDPQGTIAHVFEKVTPDTHGDDILAVLKDLKK